MMQGFELLPWQASALETPLSCDLVLAGGRGGGKSYALAALVIQYVTLHPHARVLVIRRTFPGLSDFVSLTMQLFPMADSGAKYNSQAHAWKLSNGATVELGILDSESDFTRYQGRNFHLIAVDEAGQYGEPRWLDLLRSCLRAPAGQATRMVIAANPGGPGHSWIYRRYISRGTPFQPFDDPISGRQVIVIPSTFHQNSHIDPTEYERNLKAATAGDPELLKAWVNGTWQIRRGAYFGSVLDEWRSMVEPWPSLPDYSSTLDGLRPHQMRQVASTRKGLGLGKGLPRWRYFLAHDFGVSAPSVTYLMAESPGAEAHGRWYPRGSLIAVSELATLADPANELNRGTGQTVPQLADAILAFASGWGVPASGIAGWEQMRLMMQQAGEPDRAGLYISRACWYAWATLPFLARSIRNPDDIDTNGPDHAADCLSYAVSHATKHQQVACRHPVPPCPISVLMAIPGTSFSSLPVAALAERLRQASAHQCEYGAMWRAVIVQAAFDAYLSGSKHRDGLAARDDARAWFGTDDFASVCDLAGLDPDWTLAHVARFASYVERNGIADRHRQHVVDRVRCRTKRQAGSLRGRFPAHHAHQAER